MILSTIWCLFSVEHERENNLIRFWSTKPSLETLAKFMGYPLDKACDNDIVDVVALWQGHTAKFHGDQTRYRLQEVKKGTSP